MKASAIEGTMNRIAALLAWALAVPASAQDFSVDCLPGQDAADAVSFAVDPRGVAHVVRLYRFLGALEYVQIGPNGGQTTLEIAGFVSQIADDELIDTDLALEGNRPWTCYYNAAQDRLEVARLSGNQWIAETVATGRGQGRWCSLIVEGRTPVVAFGSDDGALRIAERVSVDRWDVAVIDAPPGLAVGRGVDLARVAGVGRVIAHRTGDDVLRMTWQANGVWQSSTPLLPAGPTGASPQVVDAGGGSVWVVHGGPAADIDSDTGLFLTAGDLGALDTFTLAQESIGGSLGAVRRGAHLLVAVREKQRSAIFGNADALALWEDAAASPVAVDLARNGAAQQRHIYRDVHLALDPFGQPAVLTSDLTEVDVGQPDEAVVCIHRRRDTDGDGVPDIVEAAWGGDPDVADTDGDGLSDFDEAQSGAIAAPTFILEEPARYGAAGCEPSGETFDDAPVFRFADAPRVGCQFTGLAVEPDALYTIDFAARVSAGSLSMWPGLGSSNASAVGRAFGFAADGLWHRERVIVPVPADNAGDLRAVFRITGGEAEVADVRVTRLDPTAVLGGHFEFADLRGWRPYGPAGCAWDDTAAENGGGSLRCTAGQKHQATGIALPGGRYLLTGAAMVESGSAAVRIGDRSSNVDVDRALGLYPRGGWQTFARMVDLPHGTPDLRIVLTSAGVARFDSIRLQPVRGSTDLVGGDFEADGAAWINRNGGRCRIARTDLLEGDHALSCIGAVEARRSRVPLRGDRLYRMRALVDCISGSCRGDVELNGGARFAGFTLGETDGAVPYERLFRTPSGDPSADVRFSIRGAALIDAVEVVPIGAGESILTNSSFEAPFALGWRRYGPAGCTVATTDAWDGSAVLRCVDQAAQQTNVPALANQRYRLSWRRRGAGSVLVRVGNRNSNADAFGGSYFGPPAGDDWIVEDRSFVWPAAGSDDLRVVLASSGPVEIDALTLTVQAGDGELIRAGQFDAGALIGWDRYGPAACEASADAAFDGAAGARCAGGGMQQTNLPLAAGRTYRLSYGWRVDAGTLQVRLGIGTSNVDFEGAGLISGRTADWARQTRIITLPDDFAGDARLVFYGSGVARIDSVSLVEVD